MEPEIKEQLILYGRKVASSGLVAGAGGNLSARSGATVCLSASGIALDEITEENCHALDIETGSRIEGSGEPTGESELHLTCYRKRHGIKAIIHTHPPWAGGIISAGVNVRPMFPEFVCDIGNYAMMEYICPTTRKLARRAGALAAENNVILMANHGILAFGSTLREAYFRSMIIEDAAKSLVAAMVAGKPRFLGDKEIEELKNLEAAKHRRERMKGGEL